MPARALSLLCKKPLLLAQEHAPTALFAIPLGEFVSIHHTLNQTLLALPLLALLDTLAILPTLASRDAFLDVLLDLQSNAWLILALFLTHQIAQQLPSALLHTVEDATEDSLI